MGSWPGRLAAAVVLVALGSGAQADARRCPAAWRAGALPAASRVVCRDGDPRCDTDGVADGTCAVAVQLCVNPSGCAPSVVDGVEVGRVSPAPIVEAIATLPLPIANPEVCTTPAVVRMPRGAARLVLRARLRVADRTREVPAHARVACRPPAGTGRAVVVTTDFETGQVATVGVGGQHAVGHPTVRVHSDAIVRTAFGRAYVVNRLLGDNVTVLDPRHGFAPQLECSTDPGSNPHDIAVVDTRKAYVTRFGRPVLWIVDPGAASCAGFRRGTIDLARFADADGLPEMDQMAVVGSEVFVSLERLDSAHQFVPTSRSQLVSIDTATDVVRDDPIVLSGANAFAAGTGLTPEPGTGKLLIAEAGDVYRTGDGGIERVDPVTRVAEGFFVTEQSLGGSITDFVIASPAKGYAIVLDEQLVNHLVAFDPSTGARLRTLATREAFLPNIALAPDGSLWLADRGLPEPGIRIFDTVTDRQRTRVSIDVGLPPFSIAFLP